MTTRLDSRACLPWRRPTVGPDKEGAACRERVRRFVRLTGLKPSTAWERAFSPWHSWDLGTAGLIDHTLVWRDEDKRYIISTEPYYYPDGPTTSTAKLEDWCTRNDWDWRQASNLGMWDPPHTVLYLLSAPRHGGDLNRLWVTAAVCREQVAA